VLWCDPRPEDEAYEATGVHYEAISLTRGSG
jgi:hypothetical protein